MTPPLANTRTTSCPVVRLFSGWGSCGRTKPSRADPAANGGYCGVPSGTRRVILFFVDNVIQLFFFSFVLGGLPMQVTWWAASCPCSIAIHRDKAPGRWKRLGTSMWWWAYPVSVDLRASRCIMRYVVADSSLPMPSAGLVAADQRLAASFDASGRGIG
jgi:hypothetical protein